MRWKEFQAVGFFGTCKVSKISKFNGFGWSAKLRSYLGVLDLQCKHSKLKHSEEIEHDVFKIVLAHIKTVECFDIGSTSAARFFSIVDL